MGMSRLIVEIVVFMMVAMVVWSSKSLTLQVPAMAKGMRTPAAGTKIILECVSSEPQCEPKMQTVHVLC